MTEDIDQLRTELLNVMAEAGRLALKFDPLSAAAFAPIPNTAPQQYVVAGTLPMIAKVLPADDAANLASQSQAAQQTSKPWEARLRLCPDKQDVIDAMEAEIAELRLFATQKNETTAAEHPAGDLTDERAWKIAVDLFGTFQNVSREGERVELQSAAEAGEFARAAIAAHLAGKSQATKVQAVPVDQGHVLRTLRSLLDGSQPKDTSGALAVIDNALKAGIAWSYDIAPPSGFISYVKANYTGDVHFHDPEWHAVRLWNAAMKNVGARLTPTAQEVTQQAAKAETAEQAEGEQANVLPPTRGTDSQHNAGEQVLTYNDIFNLLMFVDPEPYGLPTGPELMGYDLECARAVEAEVVRRCRAQRTNNNDNGSVIAPTTSTVSAPEAWISVDDARKPEPKTPILLFVRTMTRGEDDDGRPYETEGAQVEMGEYRANSNSQYFDCYVSPMSDNDWVTHWMPLPEAPRTTSGKGEAA